MNSYTITVTEKQAKLIAQALDLVSRLQMGQCQVVEFSARDAAAVGVTWAT